MRRTNSSCLRSLSWSFLEPKLMTGSRSSTWLNIRRSITSRIFSYDVTGGRSEVKGFAGTGSGSIFACNALKKLYRQDMAERDIVTAAVQALYDAADDDSATGGPDLTRRLFPLVALVTEEGYRQLPQDEVDEIAAVVADLGRATATMHAAADDESGHSLVPFSTERAIDAAIAADEEGFAPLLVDFAHSYGARARADHQIFVDLFRNGKIPGL